MPNTDLFDRNEGYGHTAGSQASKDDADWTSAVSVLAQQSETLANRILRTLVARVNKSPDLNADDAWDGTWTDTGSATALAAVDAVANHDLNVDYRDADEMDSTERATTGFADRTDGWGHSSADDSDLEDA